MPIVAESEARQTAERALVRAGVPAENARLQVDLWLDADLRGVPSHGLLRLDRLAERLAAGLIDPKATGTQEWRGSSYLLVDGENGLGPVVANAALDAVTARARETGIALAAIRNSQHLGMLAWYTERIARDGQAAIVLSTSEALVHPWGGRHAMLGTNPISIAVPTGEADPFVMDTATSRVSMGEIHDYANRGEAIPPDWALDARGDPTTDPQAAKAGAIAPFGDAKGYALGLAFELLVSALSGAALGTDVHGTLDAVHPCNKGDVFIVIDGPKTAGLSAYLELIRAAVPASGFDRVLVPGERGRAKRAERMASGVPIADAVWQRIQHLAQGAPTAEQVTS
ncbi:Ldh family oxidoreductase [Devosia chinhatensis]|uniref:Dehydrogenase n=1 Tax=Devosia chinhatensis TaxID=429727 RepID=A0A0F5FM58_9HYPH|nr:Ldh family oxidoreductase [Devosia chinhatensis]KKB09282.1 dehydrogenase [Devosia chinhatensis]